MIPSLQIAFIAVIHNNGSPLFGYKNNKTSVFSPQAYIICVLYSVHYRNFDPNNVIT